MMAHWLQAAQRRAPDRVAVATPGGSWTFDQLAERADRAAGVLAGRGVRRGDRVALVLEPGLAFVEALHGCLRLGAVAMPISPRLTAREIELQAASAATIVDVPIEGRVASPALDDAHELDAVAVVVHTSGTTGDPVPVELTYGNWWWSAVGSALALGLDPAERWLSALPLNHVGGLTVLLRSAIYGTTAILHPRFDVERTLDALAAGDATLVSLVPTTLQRLLDAGLTRAPELRCVLVGGAPLPSKLAERAAQAGVPVAQTYGLTQSCAQVAVSRIGERGSVGCPVAGTEIRIAPDGEVLIDGPTVAPGARAADGMLHSGDLGRLDERGRLVVTGRKSDTIVTGGENVAPVEVENVLAAHPAILEAAVHGRPDPRWGEAVVATVVVSDGARIGDDELRAHCAQQLASFKVPKEIARVDALPRTPSGKLLRRAL